MSEQLNSVVENAAIISSDGSLDMVIIDGVTYSGTGYTSIADARDAGKTTLAFAPGFTVADPLLLNAAVWAGVKVVGTTASLYNYSADLRAAAFTGNTNSSNGGALEINTGGTIAIVNSLFDGNRTNGTDGGALYGACGKTDISNSTFSSNYSSKYGGAISYTASDDITITDSLFVSNSASTNGGAIYFTGGKNNAHTIYGGTFAGNRSYSAGGAITINGTNLTIDRSEKGGTLFSGNQASARGGAVSVVNGGTLNVTGATFADNTTTGSECPGAISANDGATTVTLTDCVFTGSNKAALNNGNLATITDCAFLTAGDVVKNDASGASAVLGGTITTAASFTGNNYSADKLTWALINNTAISLPNLSIASDAEAGLQNIILANSASVDLGGQNLTGVTIALATDASGTLLSNIASGTLTGAVTAAGNTVTAGQWFLNNAVQAFQNYTAGDTAFTLNTSAAVISDDTGLPNFASYEDLKTAYSTYAGGLRFAKNYSIGGVAVNGVYNAALTVDAGVTLTVTGLLTVRGSGVNNGTITVDGASFIKTAEFQLVQAIDADRAGWLTGNGTIQASEGYYLTENGGDYYIANSQFTAAAIVSAGGTATHVTVDGIIYAGTGYDSIAAAKASGASVIAFTSDFSVSDPQELTGFTWAGLNVSGTTAPGTKGNGNAELRGAAFTGNSNTGDGGAISSIGSGELRFIDSLFRSNSASNDGGVVYVSGGTLTVAGSTFSSNSCPHYGAVIDVYSGAMSVTDSLFVSNSASTNAGAIYLWSYCNPAVISGGTFASNTSNGMSGAVTVNAATLTINASEKGGTLFSGNRAGARGGAISVINGGKLNITGATFADNITTGSECPGAISANDGATKVTLTDCVFTGSNKAALNNGNLATITDCAFLTAGDVVKNDAAGASAVLGGTITTAASFTGNNYSADKLTWALINNQAISLPAVTLASGAEAGLQNIILANSASVDLGGQNLTGVTIALATDASGDLLTGAVNGTAIGAVTAGGETVTAGQWFFNSAVQAFQNYTVSDKAFTLNTSAAVISNGEGLPNFASYEDLKTAYSTYAGGLRFAKDYSIGGVAVNGVYNAALTVDAGVTLTVTGRLTVRGSGVNNGTITVDGASFIKGEEFLVKAIDADRAGWLSGNAVTATAGYFISQSGGDYYVSNKPVEVAAVVSAGGTATSAEIGGVVYTGKAYASAADAITAGETVLAFADASSTGPVTLNGITWIGLQVSGNTANSALTAGNAELRNSAFTGNSNTGVGGAVIFTQGGGMLAVTDAVFTGNSAGGNGGGAIYFSSGTLAVSGSTFSRNKSQNYGGAISRFSGTLAVTDAVFTGNNAGGNGGGIYIAGGGNAGTISGGTFANNTASFGAAVTINASALTIGRSEKGGTLFAGNRSYGRGAINVVNSGTLNVTGATFAGNITTGSECPGAISANDGATTVTLTECVFTGNSNGAFNNGGTATITDCSFLTASDSITSTAGTVTFVKSIILNGALKGAGTYQGENVSFSFGGGVTHEAVITVTGAQTELTFTGAGVTFASGQDFTVAAKVSVMTGAPGVVASNLTLDKANTVLWVGGTETAWGETVYNRPGSAVQSVDYVGGSIIASNQMLYLDSTVSDATHFAGWSALQTAYEDYAGEVTVNAGKYTISGVTFAADGRTAITVTADAGLELSGITFNGNAAALVNNGAVTVTGLLTLGTDTDTINNQGTITIDGASFLDGSTVIAKVVSGYDGRFSGNDITADQGYFLSVSGGDLYVSRQEVTFAAIISNGGTAATAEIGGVTYAGNKYGSAADAIAAGEQTLAFADPASDPFETAGRTWIGVSVSGATVHSIHSAGNAVIQDAGFSGNTIYEISHSQVDPEYNGAALLVSGGSLTLNNTVFEENFTGVYLPEWEAHSQNCGGAVYVQAGDLIVNGGTFRQNFTNNKGGAVGSFGDKTTMTFNNVEFSGNTAYTAGGAIYGYYKANINGGTFTDGAVVGGGAAVQMVYGLLKIDKFENQGALFAGNTSGQRGGAVNVVSGGHLSVTGATFSGNFAGEGDIGGGAICINDGANVLTVTDTLFTGNSTAANGGAINAGGTSTITGSTFATVTDTIYNEGAMTFADSNTLGASVINGDTGTVILDNAAFTFINSEGINFAAFTGTAAGLAFNGDAAVNFASADFSGLANITVTNAALATQQALWTIASGATFADNQTITVNGVSAQVNGAAVQVGTAGYRLKYDAGNGLRLEQVTRQDFVAFSTEWTSEAYPKTITVAGTEHQLTWGVNAFNTGAEALAMAKADAVVAIADGKFGDSAFWADGRDLYVVGNGTNLSYQTLAANAEKTAVTPADGTLTLAIENASCAGNLVLNGGQLLTPIINGNSEVKISGFTGSDKELPEKTEKAHIYTAGGTITGDLHVSLEKSVISYGSGIYVGGFVRNLGGYLTADITGSTIGYIGFVAQAGNTFTFAGETVNITGSTLTGGEGDGRGIYIGHRSGFTSTGKMVLNLEDSSVNGSVSVASATANAGREINVAGTVTVNGDIKDTDTLTVISGADLVFSGCTVSGGTSTVKLVNNGTITVNGTCDDGTTYFSFYNRVEGETIGTLTSTNGGGIYTAADKLYYYNGLYVDSALVETAVGTEVGIVVGGETVTALYGVNAFRSSTDAKAADAGATLTVLNEAFAANFYGKGDTVFDDGSVALTTYGGKLIKKDGDVGDSSLTITGGTFASMVVGGSRVSVTGIDAAVTGGTAALNVSGGTLASHLVAAGYVINNGDAGTASLTVTESNLTLANISTDNYAVGGVFVNGGTASVGTVNAAVTSGTYKSVFGGGWAQKGTSAVTTANIIVSGGSIHNLYAGGTDNGDGNAATVGTANITISNGTVRNVFLNGKYSRDTVNAATLNVTGACEINWIEGLCHSMVASSASTKTAVNIGANLTVEDILHVDEWNFNTVGTLLDFGTHTADLNGTEGAAVDTVIDFQIGGQSIGTEGWTAIAAKEFDGLGESSIKINSTLASYDSTKSAWTSGAYTVTLNNSYDDTRKALIVTKTA